MPSSRDWLTGGVAGVLACLMAAGCSTGGSPAGAQSPSQPTSTGVDVPASSSPTLTASSPTVTSAGVEKLLVSPSVRRELTAAYVAFMRFKPSGIAGTAANSVYYAYDTSTDVYWAMATFEPSAAALRSKPGSPMFNELVGMQDGGNQGLFTRTDGGSWEVEQAGDPPQCQIVKFFPKAVIKAWALNLLSCPAAG